MHGLLRHLHGGDRHSHDGEPPAHLEATPPTTGTVIHWANRYDWVVQIMAFGQAGRLRRQSIDFAQIMPGEHVLDVGCGTGDLTLRARERAGAAGQVCGIDPGPEMIAVARRKAARAQAVIDFRVAVVEQLPYPDASFDVVLISLVLHHLPADLKSIALAEIRRVLRSPDVVTGKPGGRLVIVEFKNLLEEQNVPAMVTAAGFTLADRRSLSFNRLEVIRAA